MDTSIALAPEWRISRETRVRVMTIIAALALVLAAFVLIQQPAGASPAKAPVAAAVAGAAVSSVSAQLPGQLLPFFSPCATVLALRRAFQGTFLFPFVQPIFDALLEAFGCTISGG